MDVAWTICRSASRQLEVGLLKVLGVSALLCLALLPLQWFVAFRSPLGTIRFSQLGFLLFGFITLSMLSWYWLRTVLSVHFWFFAFFFAGWALWGTAILTHGDPPSFPAQQFAYAAATVGIAAFIAMAGHRPTSLMPYLRWSAPITLGSLLAAFGVSFSVNGIPVLAVISRSLASGNPGRLTTELYGPAFGGFGFSSAESVSQMRHEVFAGLLVGMLVGAWAQRFPGAPPGALALRAHKVSVLVGSFLLVLSLSRSIQLAAIFWMIVGAARYAQRNGAFLALGAGLFSSIVVGAGLLLTGAGDVVVARIADPQSYEARAELVSAALQGIPERALLGGPFRSSESTHTMVLDALLRGGLLMALAWAGMVLVYSWTAARLATRLTAAAWMVPVVASFGLPIVRMFTIGAGLMNPPEWMAIAFGLGAAIVVWSPAARPVEKKVSEARLMVSQ